LTNNQTQKHIKVQERSQASACQCTCRLGQNEHIATNGTSHHKSKHFLDLHTSHITTDQVYSIRVSKLETRNSNRHTID